MSGHSAAPWHSVALTVALLVRAVLGMGLGLKARSRAVPGFACAWAGPPRRCSRPPSLAPAAVRAARGPSSPRSAARPPAVLLPNARDRRIDTRHHHPVTQPQPHAEPGTLLTEQGKEGEHSESHGPPPEPRHRGWEGGLQPPDELASCGAEPPLWARG